MESVLNIFKEYFCNYGSHVHKGHPPIVDLRYGEEDSISPSKLVFAAIKG